MADLFNYVQGKPFYSLSGNGINAAATQVTVSDFTLPDGTNITMSMFGDTGYGTFEPGTDKEENFSFTGVTQNGNGTATLTGLTRGLRFISPYTADSGLAQGHGGNTPMVLSNSAPFYNELSGKDNDETITGTWTFTDPNYPRIDNATPGPLDDEQFATKKYVDDTAIAGSPKATDSVFGISKLSVAAVDPVEPIVVGDNDNRVSPVSLATVTADIVAALDGTGTPSGSSKYVTNDDTATTSSAGIVVRAGGSGKINEGFLQITDDQAAALTDGSDVSSFHTHDDTTVGIKSISETPTYYLSTIPMVDVFTETSQTNTYRGSFANTAPSSDVTNSSITIDAIYFDDDAVLDFGSGKQVIVEFEAVFRNGNTSEQGGFGLAANVAPFSDYDDATVAAVNFSFQSTDLIYAHTSTGAGGAAHTETQLSGVNIFTTNIYRIVFNPASNALFYVNGELKATITTNLPTTGTIRFGWGSSGNDGNYISKISPVIVRVER